MLPCERDAVFVVEKKGLPMEIVLNLIANRELPATMPVLIRGLLNVERTSFLHPWTGCEFADTLAAPHTALLTAQDVSTGMIVGFVVFRSLTETEGEVLSCAVHAEYRRCKIGATMLRCVVGRLKPGQSVSCRVWERNVPAQVFLRAYGWRFVEIVRRAYEENDDDAYVFRYSFPEEQPKLAMAASVAIPR